MNTVHGMDENDASCYQSVLHIQPVAIFIVLFCTLSKNVVLSYFALSYENMMLLFFIFSLNLKAKFPVIHILVLLQFMKATILFKYLHACMFLCFFHSCTYPFVQIIHIQVNTQMALQCLANHNFLILITQSLSKQEVSILCEILR